MPFTLCHPALVLPLHAAARGRMPLAALAIGSMAPDFAYFLSIGPGGAFTHSAAGIVLYCLPAGLAAYLVYHLLLREAFIAWAPAGIAARMAPTAPWLPRDAGSALLLVASLALGAASHIAWDAFTHANTVVVRHVALLRTPLALGGQAVPLYKLLQHLSSAVGLLVIAAYVMRWLARTPPCQPVQGRPGARHGLAVLLLVAGAGALGSLAGLLYRPAASFERGLFNAVVTGMATATLALLLLAAARKLRLAWAARRGA